MRPFSKYIAGIFTAWPYPHEATHRDGGSDELRVERLATAGDANTVPVSQGDGSLDMELPPNLIAAKKGSVGTINKGEAVYVSGWNVGGWHEVELAKADSDTTMPCVGIASGTITNAVEGFVQFDGALLGVDTQTPDFNVGDDLYVSAAVAGALTKTKPTGATNQIQKVAQCLRRQAINGVLEIFGAGRANDLPNIAENNTWIGNSSGVPTATNILSYSSKVYFVGKHGDDTNSGKSWLDAFLTFGAAQTAADADTPGAANRIGIVCFDDGIYNENLTISEYCDYYVPNATIAGTVTVTQHTQSTFGRVDATGKGADALIRSGAGAAGASVRAKEITTDGAYDAVHSTATAGTLMLDCTYVNAATGSGVHASAATGLIMGYAGYISISGAGIGVECSAATFVQIYSNLVLASSGDCYNASSTGEIDAICHYAAGTNVANIGAGASLKAFITKPQGSEAGAGTIDIVTPGAIDHDDLTGVGEDDHHNRQHALDSGSDHTGSLPEGSVAFDDSTGHTHTGSGSDGTKIDHTTGLVNEGSNTHAQIDTHLGSASNPHVVTLAQVGLAQDVLTTAGGAATEVFSASGATNGCFALAVLHTEGSTPRAIKRSWGSGTDQVSVEFDGDPSTDHVVNLLWEV